MESLSSSESSWGLPWDKNLDGLVDELQLLSLQALSTIWNIGACHCTSKPAATCVDGETVDSSGASPRYVSRRILAATLPERGSFQSASRSQSSLSVLPCSWLCSYLPAVGPLFHPLWVRSSTSCGAALSLSPDVNRCSAHCWSLFFFLFPPPCEVTEEIPMKSRVAINVNTPWQNWRVARPDCPAVWLQAFREALQLGRTRFRCVFLRHAAPSAARGPLAVAPAHTTPRRAARGSSRQSSFARAVHVHVAVLLWSALAEGLNVDAIVLCVRLSCGDTRV